MSAVQLVHDGRNILGEGLVWNEADGRVWWTDIESCRLHALDPRTGEVATCVTPERVGCFAPRANGAGLIVGFASGFALWDPATGKREHIAAFEPDLPDTRLNDGRTDRQGRLVAGGFDERGGGRLISSVVRVDPGGAVTRLLGEVGCANGTCFSPDGGTLYFADSMRAEIWSFAYDGQLGERRTVATFADQPGIPDGSCSDEEGGIWNAQWNGHRVARFLPDGTVDRIIAIPCGKVTCVTFGGPDLGTLYITTARYSASADELAREPLAGALFACRPGVRGQLDTPFAG